MTMTAAAAFLCLDRLAASPGARHDVPGESATVFHFADGSVGPGKFDPSHGGRIVPDDSKP